MGTNANPTGTPGSSGSSDPPSAASESQPAIDRQTMERICRAKWDLEGMIDCVADLMVQVDNDGVVKRCNLAFANLADRPFQQLIGLKIGELLAAAGLLAAGKCGKHCREFSHPASGRVYCCTAYPVTDQQGELRGRVLTFQEITQQLAAARRLERKNEELAGAYEELKHSHARLLQQEKLAAIGQLAAGVAHEINNPVGFVTSNLGTLAKYLGKTKAFFEQQQQLLDRVAGAPERDQAAELRQQYQIDFVLSDAHDLLRECLEGVERVKLIVQNLKNFSRVDQARFCSADINRCLEETLAIAWNELKYKAEVVKHYGELPPTWCHPQQLNQVFLNLLINAAQAIEKRGKITIRTWHKNGAIMVTITDTGRGIAPEHLSRLFEPFFTTKAVGQGTGLGLSIAYDIVVKQHGGEVTASSAPGVGATFRVRLPVRGEKDSGDSTGGRGGSGQGGAHE
ncbi:ATP-binding protein [Desulfurivibrio alkaliphilus]|uniref:histidine kinase n=1 Tax=Desulfurivibrio alkaliphilus (strain DSM 19089 / UNIQEM U267 / AHT2) TaxID=589865 RepID=D6Z438_DESAT|nr:ATP-binding protein [Desulfurivibrio alkaliphilus]ADH86313.1 PAS/PAC sensor signal transduction histidine kinase [Desulfurivibrio alkaliphilus AHT 2]